MIDYKIPQEIEVMKRGGHILKEVLSEVLREAKLGVSELELNDLAEKLIRKKGAEPGFQRVRGWKHAICISSNDVVVHGIPTKYRFKEGDVVGIDCGVFLEGFNTDMAETIRIKKQESRIKDAKDDVEKFLETGKKALNEAIKVATIGNHIGHISKTIQDIVERQN